MKMYYNFPEPGKPAVGEIIFVVKKSRKKSSALAPRNYPRKQKFLTAEKFIINYIAVLIINNHHVSKLYSIRTIIGFHLFLAIITVTYLFN